MLDASAPKTGSGPVFIKNFPCPYLYLIHHKLKIKLKISTPTLLYPAGQNGPFSPTNTGC